VDNVYFICLLHPPTNFSAPSFLLQNLIATRLRVQKITCIIVYDMIEKKTFESLLDIEVSILYLDCLLFCSNKLAFQMLFTNRLNPSSMKYRRPCLVP